MSETDRDGSSGWMEGPKLAEALPAAMVELYAAPYAHDRTAAIEPLADRRVVAFLGANHSTPGIACELSCLYAAPLTPAIGTGVG